MSLSWPSARMTVSAARVSNRPVGCGKPVLVQFHGLDRQFRAVECGDGAQPVDLHALALGLLGFHLVGRHLLAGAAVDDERVVGAQPAGHPGGVHRGVAAAVDGHPAPDHGPLPGGDAAQERHGVDDRPGVLGRDVDPLGQVRAHRDERGVEAAFASFGVQVLDPVAGGEAHAHRGNPADLGVEDVTRHPVGRDAVAHHPAGRIARVPDLDLVAEPGQVVGGRQAARPGTDDEHPPAAADGGGIERPLPLDRQVAEEPLDRVNRDRAVQVGAVADALARVVADPPVDGRHRVVGGQLAPGLFMMAHFGVRQPGLNVLPGRASGIARRQQVQIDGPLLPNGPGAGASVQQVGQLGNVRSLWLGSHIVTGTRS